MIFFMSVHSLAGLDIKLVLEIPDEVGWVGLVLDLFCFSGIWRILFFPF